MSHNLDYSQKFRFFHMKMIPNGIIALRASRIGPICFVAKGSQYSASAAASARE
jgi:hypothetical protein